MPPERRAPCRVLRAAEIQRLAFRSLIFFSWHEIFFMVQSVSQDAKEAGLGNKAAVDAAPIASASGVRGRINDQGRKGAAREYCGQGPMDERDRPQSGHVWEHLRPLQGRAAHHAICDAL